MTIYPIQLAYNELNWRLSVSYDSAQNCFMLTVNQVSVLNLPDCEIIVPDCPEIINSGEIILNNEEIELEKWSASEFQRQRSIKLENDLTKDVTISDLDCSSGKCVSGIVYEISETVSRSAGIDSLRVIDYGDKNELERWPFDQLALKAVKCKELVLDTFFEETKVESRGLWLELAG